MMKLTPGDRFHHLAQRSSVAALVVLNGGNYRLFYLHNDPDAQLFGKGFRLAGVLGLTEGKIELECAPGDETAYVMKLARADFEKALAARTGGEA